MRFFVFSIAFVLASCASSREQAAPLVVGPGPCDDLIVHDAETRQLKRGCVGVPLVEATRTMEGGAVTVSGRVLVGGSLEPLSGAVVAVVGRPHGTQAGTDGRFSLGGLTPEERFAVTAPGMWPDTLVVGAVPGPRQE